MEHAQQLRGVCFTLIVVAVALISGLHFTVGTTTVEAHAYHVILRSLFVLPIIGAAVWFRLRGALLAAFSVSMIYGVHVMTTWRGSLVENMSQTAMIAMYLVIGCVAGGLSDLEDRQRRARQVLEMRMQRDTTINALEMLSRALKWRDSYTQRHSESVADLAVTIGRELRMTPSQLDRIRLAARVHDIGKIGVRDDVLLKPGKLSQVDKQALERHPEVAADILRSIPGTVELASIVVAHHECPDGTGYPRGLRGDQIPPEAHVVRTADVYCAITEDRPYQSGLEMERALSLMDQLRGSKLDAQALTALASVLRRPSMTTDVGKDLAQVRSGDVKRTQGGSA